MWQSYREFIGGNFFETQSSLSIFSQNCIKTLWGDAPSLVPFLAHLSQMKHLVFFVNILSHFEVMHFRLTADRQKVGKTWGFSTTKFSTILKQGHVEFVVEVLVETQYSVLTVNKWSK